jgi:release factor glutamine methyltransferase
MSTPMTVRRALETSGLVPGDAQVLLAHVLGTNRAWLAAHAADSVSPAQANAFFALADRRRKGEPVAYLTGVREFWGLQLIVTPAVLVPRPETETLVELALAWLDEERDARVLDLGTGSGAIALAIASERPKARVLATDVSPPALDVARANAERLGLRNVELALSDWFSAVPPLYHGAPFDLIVSNPPYVDAGDPHLTAAELRHEPAIALSPRGDGLSAVRQIVSGAMSLLRPDGGVIVEHGYDQGNTVRELFVGAGYVDIAAARDLAGIFRVVGGRRPREPLAGMHPATAEHVDRTTLSPPHRHR